MNFTLQIYDLFGYGLPGLAFCFLAARAWPGLYGLPKDVPFAAQAAGTIILAFAVGVVFSAFVAYLVEQLTQWGAPYPQHSFPGADGRAEVGPETEHKPTSGRMKAWWRRLGHAKAVNAWRALWGVKPLPPLGSSLYREDCRRDCGKDVVRYLCQRFGVQSRDLLYRCCRTHLMNFQSQTHFECERQMGLRGFCYNMVAACVPLGIVLARDQGVPAGIIGGLLCALLLVRRANHFGWRVAQTVFIGCYTALLKGGSPMARRPSIAIDGPVSAGKSTIARLVAQRLGFIYIDTGAMYRAFAWAAKGRGLTPAQPEAARQLLEAIAIRLVPQPEGGNRVFVDAEEVTEEIRTSEIGQLASQLSKIPAVRARLVALQQEMARGGGVVMEGRDIQTVVMPDAEVKIFLIASPEERARRRCLELQERGLAADFESVLAELRERDLRDSTRAHSPLRAAPDAVTIDSDGLSIEQVAACVLEVVCDRT